MRVLNVEDEVLAQATLANIPDLVQSAGCANCGADHFDEDKIIIGWGIVRFCMITYVPVCIMANS
jgi:hypothetical protein